MFREFGLTLGKALVLILALLIVNISYLFAITAIVTLFFLFVANKAKSSDSI